MGGWVSRVGSNRAYDVRVMYFEMKRRNGRVIGSLVGMGVWGGGYSCRGDY